MFTMKNRLSLFLLCSLFHLIKAQEQATCGQNRCIELFDPDDWFSWLDFDPFECGIQCDDPCTDIGECLLTGGGNGGCETGQYCVNALTHIAAAQAANYEGIDPCRCAIPEIPEFDCFSSMSTVDIEHKGKTLVKDIKVGDKVLTGSNVYQTVYTIDHKNPDKETNFIQIYSTGNDAIPLEITKSHMVFIHGKKDPVPASAVRVGDSMQTANGSSSTVTRISSITRKGLWNPITADGTIVVDGILTSTYNSVFENDDSSDEAKIVAGGFNLLSHHEFLHLLMAPYRTICLGLSLSFCESDHEFNTYSSIGNFVLKIYKRQDQLVQDMMVVGLLGTFKLLHLMMHPVVLIGAVFGIYYSTFVRNGEKSGNLTTFVLLLDIP